MKITVEPTDRITVLPDGTLCREWDGVTEKGIACTLYVALVRVREDADREEFERDLVALHLLPDPERN